MSFLEQLQQRRVFRVAAVYAATAFVVLQAADLLSSGLGLPDWVFPAVTVVAIVGFPIALLLAWVFPVSPHARDSSEFSDAPIRKDIFPARTALLVVALVLSGVAIGWLVPRLGRTDRADAVTLAVLPFSNLGAPSDEYFADGMSDALRGKLAALEGMTVIASSSSRPYRDSNKSPRQIGKELGVRYLLTGTVRWARNPDGSGRVQVNPELVVTTSGTTRWQQSFDAVLSDVFAVQGEIAGQVADALSINLLEQRKAQLAARPTTNLEAYDAYLRASALLQQAEIGAITRRLAAEEFQRAVDLDPNFALAWAQLSYAHTGAYWYYEDNSDERRRLARVAADRALALQPNLAAALIADAYYWYWGFRQYHRALSAFKRAVQLEPNNSLAIQGIASVHRRSGNVSEAVTFFKKAATLNPRDASIMRELAITLVWAGRYQEADAPSTAGITLAPEAVGGYLARAHVQLGLDRAAHAQATLRDMMRVIGTDRAASELANRSWTRWLPLTDSVTLRVLERLPLTSQVADTGSYYMLRAEWMRHVGRTAEAILLADSAVSHLETQAPLTNDWWFGGQLAIAHALAGRRDRAVAQLSEVRNAKRIPDAMDRSDLDLHAAKTYAYLGDHAETLRQIEAALRPPTSVTRAFLRADTRFAFLRGDARFRQLVGDPTPR